MVRVRTQAEVCRHFGKPEDQRIFVSRKIKKGEVIKENGGYTIVEEVTITPRGVKDILEEEHSNIFDDYDNKIRDLKIENDKLKKELEKKELEKELANQTTASSSELEKELEEYKVNCEYWHNQFEKMKRGYELVIEMTYKEITKHTKIEKSEYKEQLGETIREIIDNEFGHED